MYVIVCQATQGRNVTRMTSDVPAVLVNVENAWREVEVSNANVLPILVAHYVTNVCCVETDSTTERLCRITKIWFRLTAFGL